MVSGAHDALDGSGRICSCQACQSDKSIIYTLFEASCSNTTHTVLADSTLIFSDFGRQTLRNCRKIKFYDQHEKFSISTDRLLVPKFIRLTIGSPKNTDPFDVIVKKEVSREETR